MLPCIAGHVGADTAGVILAETPYLSDELRLIVDVGTNAEIVLGNRDRLLAATWNIANLGVQDRLERIEPQAGFSVCHASGE